MSGEGTVHIISSSRHPSHGHLVPIFADVSIKHHFIRQIDGWGCYIQYFFFKKLYCTCTRQYHRYHHRRDLSLTFLYPV
jgi:hypothetical protein